MPRQPRSGQLVKRGMTPFTLLFLPRRLGGIPTLLREFSRATGGATYPVRPAQLANGLVALDLVQQIVKVDHRGGTRGRALENSFNVAPDRRQGELFSTVCNPD